MMHYLYAFCVALLAGFVDAIAGGGGLIQLPGLIFLFPQVPIAYLLGTNKLASSSGTLMASYHFAHTLHIRLKTVLPAIVAAFLFSLLGAHTATQIDNEILKPIVFILLLGIGGYVLVKKNLGLHPVPKSHTAVQLGIYFALIGMAFGFYDGFLGPGVGSMLIFIYIGWLGCDFLHGSAYAKLTNLASNVAAMLYFGFTHHIFYKLGLLMAVGNVIGNLFGAKLAIKKGSGFVRVVFLVVIIVILMKLWESLMMRL
ncbi:MAG: TSUP family transporter [Gammaproteobacteria bacterium]